VGYADSMDEPVLSDINLSLSAGDRVGLLGVNGAGKSTLVKALSSGSTVLSGERILHKDTKIGYFAQHQLDSLIPEESPIDHLRKYAPGDREQDLRNYLGRFGFGGERIFEPVAPLSGGEKARLALALMIRQNPNLLLLDEPTNHLDLEMRQALCVALIEYSGALVVISHDRHLLRSVCDELLIVHDGIVDRFQQSLDEYPAWLKQRQASESEQDESTDTLEVVPRSVNKKELRQQEAQRRQRLKPLLDKIRSIEKHMTSTRENLASMDQELADEKLYTDPDRKAELTQRVKDQATLKTELETLEWNWLEASEELEKAN
jgi:ATP-binding cassette subfamily F protein 3